jgi:hypothetical protein
MRFGSHGPANQIGAPSPWRYAAAPGDIDMVSHGDTAKLAKIGVRSMNSSTGPTAQSRTSAL